MASDNPRSSMASGLVVSLVTLPHINLSAMNSTVARLKMLEVTKPYNKRKSQWNCKQKHGIYGQCCKLERWKITEELIKQDVHITEVQDIRQNGNGWIGIKITSCCVEEKTKRKGKKGTGFIVLKKVRSSTIRLEPVNARISRITKKLIFMQEFIKKIVIVMLENIHYMIWQKKRGKNAICITAPPSGSRYKIST